MPRFRFYPEINIPPQGDAQCRVIWTGTELMLDTTDISDSGLATLVGGTVTVNNSRVTASSRIFLSHHRGLGTIALLRVSARVVGVSFTISSLSALDVSEVAWLMYEP